MSYTRNKKGNSRVSKNEIRGLKSDRELREEAVASAKANTEKKHKKQKSIPWRELTNLAKGNESIGIATLEARKAKAAPIAPTMVTINKHPEMPEETPANSNLTNNEMQAPAAQIASEDDLYLDLPVLDDFVDQDARYQLLLSIHLNESFANEVVNAAEECHSLPRITSFEFALPIETQHGYMADNAVDHTFKTPVAVAAPVIEEADSQTNALSTLAENSLFTSKRSARLKSKRERAEAETTALKPVEAMAQSSGQKHAKVDQEEVLNAAAQPTEAELTTRLQQVDAEIKRQCDELYLLFQSKPRIAKPEDLPIAQFEFN